jgi:2-aminoethylphosphonate-pyruvate transaminase
MVAESVRQALLHPNIGHRVPAFEEIMKSIQQDLLEIFKASDDYTALLITGSGTAANETVISSAFTDSDEVLLINNGEFGCRLEELLQIHEVKTTVLNYDWGQRPNLVEIEELLKSKPTITAVMLVHHETSTGLLNPVPQIGKLAAQYKKSFIVDAVSSLTGEDLDVVRDNIDFCTTSSCKCLASLPGVGIICAKKAKLEQIKNNKIRIAYLNLSRLYEMSHTRSQTPNTPSVTMFIALEAALKRLLEEGLQNQIDRHRRCAAIIRDGVKNLGLKMLLEPEVSSNTVTSVFLPEGVALIDFVSKLDQKGYTVYPGKRHLKEKGMFQIANMGEIDERMCRGLLNEMEKTLLQYAALAGLAKSVKRTILTLQKNQKNLPSPVTQKL